MSQVTLTKEQKESLLTERELREYKIYMRLNRPPMAPSTAQQFLNLFLLGNNCEDIVRVNPNGFSLGAIVRARLENNWDEIRADHQQQLLDKIRSRVQQVTLETVDRIVNELAASNKLVNDRLLLYLQTGDEKHLQGMKLGGALHMRQMVEMLQKLTGQQNPKSPSVVLPPVSSPPAKTTETSESPLPSLPEGKPVDVDTADKIIESVFLAQGGRK